MAEINASTNAVTNSNGPIGEEFTQSLDQLVKKKLKEAVKGIKKKMDETPAQGGVQHPFTMTEPFSRQSMNRLNTLNLMSAGQHLPGLQTSEQGRLGLNDVAGLSATTLSQQGGQGNVGKRHPLTDNRLDVELKAARHSGDRLTELMPRSHAQPPSQPDTDARQHALSQRGGENTLLSDTRTLEHLPVVEQEGHSLGGEGNENTLSEFDTLTAGEHARVNLADRGGRSGHLPTAETPHAQQRSGLQASNLLDPAPAEKADGSKLTYRFSEWGGGHQVNVQLGVQHRTPHVLQPSDALVHQRLADYDGQSQGDWVFSDDQEQSGKRRQQPDEGTE